jgi:hypothetical protein
MDSYLYGDGQIRTMRLANGHELPTYVSYTGREDTGVTVRLDATFVEAGC